jgi:membrane-associated phospholipid phosphatase
MRDGRRLATFRSPTAIAAVAGAGLAGTYAVAVRRPVPRWELDVTTWINDWPDTVATGLYPVMQLGTLGGPAIVAIAIGLIRRDWWLALATIVTGIVTWFAAKGVKRLVDRDRPLGYLPDVLVREGDGTGLGYLSGHSAVTASAAIMAMVAMPPRWRPVAAARAVLVGLARIVHGVHLPADVVGGWSLGTLFALGGLAVLDLAEGRRAG